MTQAAGWTPCPATSEIRALLCGDPKCREERKQIAEKVAPTQLWLVNTLTAEIAPRLGVATELIVPVVVPANLDHTLK